MKLLNILGQVVELTNLESIIRISGGFSIKRSAKGNKNDLLECPIYTYCISISELTNIIFEAESKFNNYVIIIEEEYDNEINKTYHSYQIKGTVI